MIGALWNGFSGISTYDRALTAESNNAANTSTAGYKSNDVRFEDLMYKDGVGRGSQVELIYKRFEQGDIQLTSHPLDIGIEGDGYFMVNERDTSDRFYTRAGNFQMDDQGYLSTPDGLRVQGLSPLAPTVITTNPDYTKLSGVHTKFVASQQVGNPEYIETINARVSDYSSSAEATGISGEGYKDKSSIISDVEAHIADYKAKLDLYQSVSTQAATPSQRQITSLDYTSFLSELSNENDFIKITIDHVELKQKFDTDIDTTMRLFADQISNIDGIKGSVDTVSGKVLVESLIPADEIIIYDAAVNDKSATITEIQEHSLGTGYGIVESSRNALQDAIELAGAEFIEITNRISLLEANQLNVNDIQMKLVNLNLSEYAFGSISTDEGRVYLADGENKFLIGKVQTVHFRDDQGLDPLGNNLYMATPSAGEPKYAGNINTLHSSSLEVSNTDNSESMVNLLTYQKAFEANSKSITTSDELLKIAINLRK